MLVTKESYRIGIAVLRIGVGSSSCGPGSRS